MGNLKNTIFQIPALLLNSKNGMNVINLGHYAPNSAFIDILQKI